MGDTRLEKKREVMRGARQQPNMVLAEEGENAEVGLLDPVREQQKNITQMARNHPAQVGGATSEDSSSTSKWRASVAWRERAWRERRSSRRGENSAKDTSS